MDVCVASLVPLRPIGAELLRFRVDWFRVDWFRVDWFRVDRLDLVSLW